MFSGVFQLFLSNTLGILKGFWKESAVFHGKQGFPGQLKIALQGAAIRP